MKKMDWEKIKPKFQPEQIVYLVTDPEQYERMVLEIHITPNGLMYLLGCSAEEPTKHYAFEISETKPL